MQMMDFAKKLEQGFRLNAKPRKGIVVPPVTTIHPLFMESKELLDLPTKNPEMPEKKNLEKIAPVPFLDTYMSKFVEDVKTKSKSRSRSKSQSKIILGSSTRHRGGRSRSRSRSRSRQKSHSNFRSNKSSRSHSKEKSASRFKSSRKSRSRSRSKSRSRSRRDSRSRSGSRSRRHRRMHSRSRSPPDFNKRHKYYDDVGRRGRGILWGSKPDKHSPPGGGHHPPKSRWDDSPERPSRWDLNSPKRPSRWDISPRSQGIHGDDHGSSRSGDHPNSGSPSRRSIHSRLSGAMKNDVEKGPKIGRTLNEMETYVEAAKQKKIAEMKRRNKEFLRQTAD